MKADKANYRMKPIEEIKLNKEELTITEQEDLLKVNSKEVSKKKIYDNEAYQLEQSYIQVIPNEFQH